MRKTEKFSKEFRLRSRRDFGYLRQESKRMRTSLVAVYWKSSGVGSECTRIGLSVSRKVGKSVIRNRLKRLIREYFRLSEGKMKAIDLLVVIYPGKIGNFISMGEYEKFLLEDVSFLFSKILR